MNNIKFYRAYYDLLCLSLLGVVITLLLLNIGIFFCLAYRGVPEYYATSMDGALYCLEPMNTTNQNT
jgi:hypothetical protein